MGAGPVLRWPGPLAGPRTSLQSDGINLQSPQSDSTPWTLTLAEIQLDGRQLRAENFKERL